MRRQLTTLNRCRAALLAAICIAAAAAAGARPRGAPPRVTVMTWNLCHGGDFVGSLDIGETFESAQASDFPQRAARIAKIIDQHQPHVVCLQEVARWQTEGFFGGKVRDINFIAILQNALLARGLAYDLVGSLDTIHLAAPGEVHGEFVNVTWTERIVILARHSPQLQVNAMRTKQYNHTFTIVLPGIDNLEFARGFIAADITFRGRKARYVCTHLEAISPSVRAKQINQLINWLSGTNPGVPVILMGDMNAPAGSSDYQRFIDNGYTDAWRVNHGLFDGPTCCQEGDLLNQPSLLTARIDHIFVRGDVSVISTSRAGHRQVDRTPIDNLWPSDHAAVVAKVRLD